MWRIKVLFENIYWYICRKIKINENTTSRASKLLTCSFGGRDSIIVSLIVKTSHMLYKIRSYSHEETRYINCVDLCDNRHLKSVQDYIDNKLTKLDKNKVVSILTVQIKPDSHDHKYQYLYQGYMEEGIFKVVEIKPKQVGLYDGIEYEGEEVVFKKKPNYEYPLDKDNTRELFAINNFLFDYAHFEEVVNKIESFVSKTYGPNTENSYDVVYNISSTITIDPKDFKELDDTLRSYVIGRIRAYHTLWNFRKELKKFYEFDGLNLDDFKSYPKELYAKCNHINDIIKKYSDCWWI